MTDTFRGAEGPAAAPAANKLYFAAWRWHFYAGLYVIPFLLMLATTGRKAAALVNSKRYAGGTTLLSKRIRFRLPSAASAV